MMRRRRRLERALIAKYDKSSEASNYVLASAWINEWESYLYAARLQIKKNYVLGLPPPQRINNSNLLDSHRKLLNNISDGIYSIYNIYRKGLQVNQRMYMEDSPYYLRRRFIIQFIYLIQVLP